ncbi:MAG: hypothetical protein ACOYJE_04430 [Bacteroidaceae bacterium]|jgi:hypothetical protein
MLKKIASFRLFLLLCVCANSGFLYADGPVSDHLVSYFQQLMETPQEKVYLHTDRTSYSAGEHIWFRGYLVNAVTHKVADAYSNFLMVELLNRQDSVIASKKVKGLEHCFWGELALDASLPAGDYYLRAYTNWMRNEDPDFFFMRLIKVGNAIDRGFTTRVTYKEAGPGKIVASLHIKNLSDPSFHPYKVGYTAFEGDIRRAEGTFETDGSGRAKLNLPYNATTTRPQYVKIWLDDDQYEYHTTLFPHIESQEYAVTFFPEGGDLLAAPNQVVAFKAQAADGYSLPVEGVVKNSRGEQVATLKTLCDGMGAFNLSAEAGEHYYAETTSAAGKSMRFDLPEVKPEGVKITASRIPAGIAYSLVKAGDAPWPDTLYVVAHVRGFLRYMQVVGESRTQDVIPAAYLPDGITHLLLLDKSGQTLSERLVFVKHDAQPRLGAATAEPAYGPREMVRMTLSLTDTAGVPLPADLSVSVTDKGLFPVDTLGETAQSSIWLTSDLKGFVENPGRYFLPSNRRAPVELNLLMLTHGWRRFATDNLMQAPDSTFRYFVERGLSFSGRVRPIVGRADGIGVVALAPSINLMLSATSDRTGAFVIQGRDFPDSTTFTVRSRGRNSLPATITMDPEMPLPGGNSKIPYPDFKLSDTISEAALRAARDRYFAEGGVPITNLKQITVKAKEEEDLPTSSPNYIYSHLADRHYGEKWMEGKESMTAWEAISQIPTVVAPADGSAGLSFQRTEGRTAALILNGVVYYEPEDYEMLKTYSAAEVKRVDLIQYNVAALQMLGTNSSAGAIVVTLKENAVGGGDENNSVVTFTPRGYNTSVQFYSPVYLTPAQKESSDPDLRTTIYWNPQVKVDASGAAELEFFTADRNAPLQVVVEGITAEGEPLHLLYEIPARKQ